MQKNDEINFASYSCFIKYMGLSRNPLKAFQVYDSIPDNSMKVNVSVCNSILGCMVRNGRFQSSIKLFDQMKDDGLSPDLVTYSSVCCKNSIFIIILLVTFCGVKYYIIIEILVPVCAMSISAAFLLYHFFSVYSSF